MHLLSRKTVLRYAASTALLPLASAFAAPESAAVPSQKDLETLLEAQRKKYRLPALAAAVIAEGKPARFAAVGIRKWGADAAVTAADPFHIGSCGKAMTATLLGILADAGKVSLDATLGDLLPDLKAEMAPAYCDVTLFHLLQHRSGLPAETFPGGGGMLGWITNKRPVAQQRVEYARLVLAQKPAAKPGKQMIYANAGYAVAGLIAERCGGGGSYENLLQQRLFAPLGMTSAGFGPQEKDPKGTDAPWPHRVEKGKEPVPVAPGPFADNPPVLSPIGRAYMTIEDWARFIAVHVGGGPQLVRPETLARLHAPYTVPKSAMEADYACGWVVTPREWAGGNGLALTHVGSNTMNFAVTWMAPAHRFAVLVATNVMGEPVPAAGDAVATALLLPLIRAYSSR